MMIKPILAAVWVGGVVTAAVGQQPQVTSRPILRGSILGAVYCDDTNKPARGADVLIEAEREEQHGERDRQLLTDLDGKFNAEGLPPGRYTVTITLRGYSSETGQDADPEQPGIAEGMPVPRQHVQVEPGQAARLNVLLRRDAAVTGTVHWDDGSPAVQVLILVEKLAKSTAGRASSSTFVAVNHYPGIVTDDQGEFRVAGLTPGSYHVAALPRLWSPTTIADLLASTHRLAVFCCDTFHRSQAKMFDLRYGEEVTGIDITISDGDLHDVSGVVMSKDGRAPNMGVVTLTDQSDPDISLATTIQGQGSFTLPGVPSGGYTVSVSKVAIGRPDTNNLGYASDDAVIPVAGFSDASGSVIVRDSDVMDLRLEVTPKPLAQGRSLP